MKVAFNLQEAVTAEVTHFSAILVWYFIIYSGYNAYIIYEIYRRKGRKNEEKYKNIVQDEERKWRLSVSLFPAMQFIIICSTERDAYTN